MTNEEKANSIINNYRYETKLDEYAAYNAALEMAAWKDQQKINMINKTIKWIEDNYQQYDEIGVNYCGELITDNLRKFLKQEKNIYKHDK